MTSTDGKQIGAASVVVDKKELDAGQGVTLRDLRASRKNVDWWNGIEAHVRMAVPSKLTLDFIRQRAKEAGMHPEDLTLPDD